MPALTVSLHGIGLVGPGLPSWAEARAVLAGQQPYQPTASAVPAPQRLPAAERRRAGLAIKLAMAAAEAACADAAVDPQGLPTVFTSSSGDGANCHALCEVLAGDDRLISPTRFTNSVHNAAAGYWHIAVGSRAASTSLCAHDASFGAGLVEALAQRAPGSQLLLVASDTAYPEPLHTVRPISDSFAVGLVLGDPAAGTPRLSVRPLAAAAAGVSPTPCRDPALEALRRIVPAARVLPLLQALAEGGEQRVVLDYQPGLHLEVLLQP